MNAYHDLIRAARAISSANVRVRRDGQRWHVEVPLMLHDALMNAVAAIEDEPEGSAEADRLARENEGLREELKETQTYLRFTEDSENELRGELRASEGLLASAQALHSAEIAGLVRACGDLKQELDDARDALRAVRQQLDAIRAEVSS